MNIYNEILRYMGHAGETTEQLEELISSCLAKLDDVCTPRHVIKQFPCTVRGDNVILDALVVKSSALASNLDNCAQAYMIAATLGAAVDRLISQRVKMDSAQALCLQACAAVKIEDSCNSIEKGLSHNISQNGQHLCPRFSPGYGDFDITHQTDILRILDAQKQAGITETGTHILTPLKSVTAVIGVCSNACSTKIDSGGISKCDECNKKDCRFYARKELIHD